jgi:hypothetical protein
VPLSWLYFQNLQRINQILKLIAIVHRRFASSAAAAAAAVVAPPALVDTVSKPTPRGD